MASAVMRFKWWLQNQLSSHKQDIYLALTCISFICLILYAIILKYESPDVTDLSHLGIVNDGSAEIGELSYARKLEKEKFERVQEKLKHMPKEKPKPKPKKKDVVDVDINNEDESKLALLDEEKEIVVKDKDYWMNKYKHIFHQGFELDGLDINAPMDELRGGKAHCTIYDHRSAVNATYDCVDLQVTNKPVICLYPTEFDVHLSQKIRLEGVWEPHILKLFTEYLNTDPNIGFIDIGANIGVYTLTAAALGHKVVAVEPYEENLKHLSQGLQLSKLEDNVIVIPDAISDKRLNFVDLRLDPTNQGGIAIDEGNHNFGCYGDDCPPQAKTIFLDDLLEVANFKSAIIKIDIEGHEHRAFRQSRELFERLYIPCIIMEWIKLRSYYGAEIDESDDKVMTQELVDYLVDQGYQAFSMVTMQKLHPSYWYAWPDDIVWKHLLVRG